jgi:hypothetical protein
LILLTERQDVKMYTRSGVKPIILPQDSTIPVHLILKKRKALPEID